MKTRITVASSKASTFVLRDVKALSDRYTVFLSLIPTKVGPQLLNRPARLAWNVFRSKVVISWFASSSYYPVLLAKVLRKRSMVIVAGYDVAKIESIGYGALIDEGEKRRTEWALRNASLVLAVDLGLIEDMERHFHTDFGAVVLPTGYDPEEYIPRGNKEQMVISVCSADSRKGLVKGIDIFAECARCMPDTRFVLIGVKGQALPLLDPIPDNLQVIGDLPPEEVVSYYQKAKVYCQLSMREGLPNAVCEAMLCDCIVVGSDVQGVRTAVGEHGYLVPYGDVEGTCEAIRKALRSPDMGGRAWIKEKFSEAERKRRLTEILVKLTGDRPG